MSSYQYRYSHYKHKAVWWLSHLYNGNPCFGKAAFLNWISTPKFIECFDWYLSTTKYNKAQFICIYLVMHHRVRLCNVSKLKVLNYICPIQWQQENPICLTILRSNTIRQLKGCRKCQTNDVYSRFIRRQQRPTFLDNRTVTCASTTSLTPSNSSTNMY